MIPSAPAPEIRPAGGLGELVVLLDADGESRGSAPKETVHTANTPLHLAFSVHLRRPDGRILLTRRALSKRTWPGVWTNAVCGHPGPGEDIEQAIRRRLRQELRIAPDQIGPLHELAPDFRYRAVDPDGVVENEVCPVYMADLLSDADGLPTADPTEVMGASWARWDAVVDAASAMPFLLSPWLVDHTTAPAIDAALRGATSSPA